MDFLIKVVEDEKVGICDWEVKQQICVFLIGGFTFSDTIDLIYRTDSRNKTKNDAVFEKAEKIKDNARKWSKHKPSSQFYQFFDDLASTLEIESELHGITIFQLPVREFISFLPKKRQDLLKYEATGIIKKLKYHDRNTSNNIYRPLWFSPFDRYETIDDCIKRGRVDQKHCYQSPESAIIWENLVNCKEYPTYDHCKSALSALVRTPEWIKHIKYSFDGVVMLGGGGAPTKDMVLINSFMENASSVNDFLYHHVLVDISSFMLQSSSNWLHGKLFNKRHENYVRVESVLGDFLDLDKCDEDRLRRNKNVAWFITAGTIGNVSEKNSLNP